MSDAKKIMEMIKEHDITYVDLRFTDTLGKMQHVTQHIDTIDPETLAEGFMFDGSSIAGWKSIDQSDMKLIADTSSVYIDPFYAEKTLCVHCNVVEPDTGEAYSRDPRGTAVKAEAYLKSSGIGVCVSSTICLPANRTPSRTITSKRSCSRRRSLQVARIHPAGSVIIAAAWTSLS